MLIVGVIEVKIKIKIIQYSFIYIMDKLKCISVNYVVKNKTAVHKIQDSKS